MRRYIPVPLLLILAVLVSVSASLALNVGSDGSDGVFSPSTSVTIDLSLAATATWNSPSPSPGKGVYDSEKWAVVFKYSSVNIPANVTVSFKNHPSGAPVVWLVQGNVTITGTVSVSGEDCGVSCGQVAAPGPGGWRAGKGAGLWALPERGSGHGPGGGGYFNSPYDYYDPIYGSPSDHGTPSLTYGNARVLPLIGGSGSVGGDYPDSTGGGGGGAILVASGATIGLNGLVNANGGVGRTRVGTGGAIRLVADTVTGSGLMRALGSSYAGVGRIRVDANTINLTDVGVPLFTSGPTTDPATIWPSEDAPSVQVVRIGGKSVPTDPRANYNNQDVRLAAPNPVTLEIEARNVPLDWVVEVRVVPVAGVGSIVQATFVSGAQALSQWTATLALPTDTSTIQVRAYRP